MPSAARALIRHRRPPRGRVPLPARAALPAALCLGAVSCAVLGTAPLAHAAAAAGWSVAPTGDGRPSFYAEGPPGTVLQDTVSVTNPGRAPVVVRLSGTGLRTAFAERAGNGIRVPARTRAEVPFTVTVPAGAAPGDRSGAVVARDARGRTATVPIRLRVGGPALAALTVEHLAVHADRITYELVNRGTTVLVPKLAVRADGVLGRVLDRAPRTLPVHLRPGARLALTEPWPDRPALDAVDLRLTVTAPGGAHATATASARFIPWPTATGATAALLTATAALLAAHRRRGTRPDTPTPERPTPDAPTPEGPMPDGSASGAPTPAWSGSDGPTASAPADGGGMAGGQLDGSRGAPVGGVRGAAGAATPACSTSNGPTASAPATGGATKGAPTDGSRTAGGQADGGGTVGALAEGSGTVGGQADGSRGASAGGVRGAAATGAAAPAWSASDGPTAGALTPGGATKGAPTDGGGTVGAPADGGGTVGGQLGGSRGASAGGARGASAAGVATPACSGSDGPTASAPATGGVTKGAPADGRGTAGGQVGGSRGVSAGGVRGAAAAADLWPGGVFTEGAVT